MAASLDTSVPVWAGAWLASLVNEAIRSYSWVESNEINRVFRLECADQNYFLKIGPGLRREYERLQWLDGRVPCPRPLGLNVHEDSDALLMTAVHGESLARLSRSLAPQEIVARLAAALRRLHATRITDWPFGRVDEGKVLVHGDACLPNFLFLDGELSGYIDVGDLAVGETEVDLAAAVWSLQYNLGHGYGLAFLREYGVSDADEERVETLRQKYELG